MKRFFIFLFLLCGLQINAQVLNQRGEKVVSKIEICYGVEDDLVTIINFTYDEQLRLEQVIIHNENSNYIAYTRKSDRIIRNDYYYDRTPVKDTKYEYILNNDGYIKKKIFKSFRYGGGVVKHEYDYYYEECNSKLSCIYDNSYYSKNDRFYESRSNDNLIKCFKWSKENKYNTEWKWGVSVDERKEYPFKFNRLVYAEGNYVNDTNVDFYEVYVNCQNYYDFENATEWVNCKSHYLINRDEHLNLDFCYSYNWGNEKCLGNIISMFVYKNEEIKYIFKIYYLE